MTLGPILIVVGTRPEAIKMGPVYHALQDSGLADRTRVILTGQHGELVRPFLELFELPVHENLRVMTPDQSLTHVTVAVLSAMEGVLLRERPCCVLVQGDTTSAMAAAMAAHYAKIPVAHVEAGLRSDDLENPFPEEFNRRAISSLASLHFAPTERARLRLLAEGHRPHDVLTTGNTGIDALYLALKRATTLGGPPPSKRTVLVTSHRRENHDGGLEALARAIRRAAAARPDIRFVFPVHPNPRVRETVYHALDGVAGVDLCAPLDYVSFVRAMRDAYFLLTDSGGVQEEAPALGKPVLVFRKTTERQEAVEAGVAKLVGTDEEEVFGWICRLLDDHDLYTRMATGGSPYGDGRAAHRIASAIKERLS